MTKTLAQSAPAKGEPQVGNFDAQLYYRTLAEQYGQQRRNQDNEANSCISNDPKKFFRAHTIMGSLQIVVGLVFLIVVPVLLRFSTLGLHIGGMLGFAAIQFILAGSFGIAARNKKKCILVTGLVFGIMAAVAAAGVLAQCGSGIKKIQYGAEIEREQYGQEEYYRKKFGGKKMLGTDGHDDWKKKWDHDDHDEPEPHHDRHHRRPPPSRKATKCMIMLHCTLTFLALIELIVAIVQSVYCCKYACCGGRVSQEPIIIYMNAPPPPSGVNYLSQPTAPGGIYPATLQVESATAAVQTPPAYTENESEDKEKY